VIVRSFECYVIIDVSMKMKRRGRRGGRARRREAREADQSNLAQQRKENRKQGKGDEDEDEDGGVGWLLFVGRRKESKKGRKEAVQVELHPQW
jgi:hypothetical protein